MSRRAAVRDDKFAIADSIVVIDENHEYNTRRGIIERLGSAGEEVTYIHARLDKVNTVITFRTFQVQKG